MPPKAPTKRTKWRTLQLQNYIRVEALTTANVVFSIHALTRMKERKISMAMALETLRSGRIIIEPEMDQDTGDKKCRMELFVAGHDVKVVVAISDDDPGLIVVTAI